MKVSHPAQDVVEIVVDPEFGERVAAFVDRLYAPSMHLVKFD
jgi:hypothetical protein